MCGAWVVRWGFLLGVADLGNGGFGRYMGSVLGSWFLVLGGMRWSGVNAVGCLWRSVWCKPSETGAFGKGGTLGVSRWCWDEGFFGRGAARPYQLSAAL